MRTKADDSLAMTIMLEGGTFISTLFVYFSANI
jgi:hypothetical protein